MFCLAPMSGLVQCARAASALRAVFDHLGRHGKQGTRTRGKKELRRDSDARQQAVKIALPDAEV